MDSTVLLNVTRRMTILEKIFQLKILLLSVFVFLITGLLKWLILKGTGFNIQGLKHKDKDLISNTLELTNNKQGELCVFL